MCEKVESWPLQARRLVTMWRPRGSKGAECPACFSPIESIRVEKLVGAELSPAHVRARCLQIFPLYPIFAFAFARSSLHLPNSHTCLPDTFQPAFYFPFGYSPIFSIDRAISNFAQQLYTDNFIYAYIYITITSQWNILLQWLCTLFQRGWLN